MSSSDTVRIGEKVIVRSNEDDPLIIGTVINFENFGHSENFPVVKMEGSEQVLVCMGIVKVYSDELLEELKPLSPKKQWNKLAENYKRE